MYTITYMYIAMHCTYWSNWPTHHSKTLLLHLMKYCVIGKDPVVQSTSMRDMGLDELISSTDRWTINQQDALLLTGLHPTLTLPHPFHIAKSTHSWPASLLDYLQAPTRRCHDTNYQYWRLLQPKESPRCPDDGAMPWVKGIKISGGESHFKSPLVETSAKIQDIW